MQAKRRAVSDSETNDLVAGPQTAGALAAPAEALPQTMTCGQVFDWLLANPTVPAAAIVD